MLSLPLIFWSTLATLITIATFYVLINYEVQRWKDKKRRREGIYIRRVTRLEALIVIFTPALPILMAAVYILEPGTEGVTLGIVGLLASAIFVAYLRYVHVAYVKISSEGVEQRVYEYWDNVHEDLGAAVRKKFAEKYKN